MNPFSVGERVTLKSGGPMMTVETVRDGDKFISVVWYDQAAVGQHIDRTGYCRAAFPAAVLTSQNACKAAGISKQ